MDSNSLDPLLGDSRVCGTGCGFADENSKAADAQARAASVKKLCIVYCCVTYLLQWSLLVD